MSYDREYMEGMVHMAQKDVLKRDSTELNENFFAYIRQLQNNVNSHRKIITNDPKSKGKKVDENDYLISLYTIAMAYKELNGKENDREMTIQVPNRDKKKRNFLSRALDYIVPLDDEEEPDFVDKQVTYSDFLVALKDKIFHGKDDIEADIIKDKILSNMMELNKLITRKSIKGYNYKGENSDKVLQEIYNTYRQIQHVNEPLKEFDRDVFGER